MKTKGFRVKGSYACYVLIYFFFYFCMAAFTSILSVYLTGIGKSATEMARIVSAGNLFGFAVLPISGYLCDRFRRTRLISLFFLCMIGLLSLVFSQCRQSWALFVLNGCVHSFLNTVSPISERIATGCKYRYGTLRVWGTLGYAVGAQVAGIAIQSFPSVVLFGSVTVAAALAALGFLGADDPDAAAKSTETAEKVSLTSFLKSPYFLLYLVISFLCMGCSGANMTYAPILLQELGLPTGAIGTALSVSTLVEIPLILFSNKFMDRFSGKTLLTATLGLFIVQYLCYGLLRSLAAVLIIMTLVKAIASTMMVMLALKMVRNLVSPALTTTGLTVVNAVNSLGTIALQNLGGIIVDRSSVHVFYLAMTALVLLALLLTAFLKISSNEKVFS